MDNESGTKDRNPVIIEIVGLDNVVGLSPADISRLVKALNDSYPKVTVTALPFRPVLPEKLVRLKFLRTRISRWIFRFGYWCRGGGDQ